MNVKAKFFFDEKLYKVTDIRIEPKQTNTILILFSGKKQKSYVLVKKGPNLQREYGKNYPIYDGIDNFREDMKLVMEMLMQSPI